MLRLISCLLLVGQMLLLGCTYSAHIVAISDFKPYVNNEKGTPIESRSSQFVILNFADNTNYVETAYKNLANKCPSGRVTGITTQYYTEHGFFSWTNHIVMQGLCIKTMSN